MLFVVGFLMIMFAFCGFFILKVFQRSIFQLVGGLFWSLSLLQITSRRFDLSGILFEMRRVSHNSITKSHIHKTILMQIKCRKFDSFLLNYSCMLCYLKCGHAQRENKICSCLLRHFCLLLCLSLWFLEGLWSYTLYTLCPLYALLKLQFA